MEKHIRIERDAKRRGCMVLVANTAGKDILSIGAHSFAAAKRIKKALCEGAWLVAGPQRASK